MLPVLAGKGGEGPEEQARFLGQQLLRRQLARRVDRQIKKPLPGGCLLLASVACTYCGSKSCGGLRVDIAGMPWSSCSCAGTSGCPRFALCLFTNRTPTSLQAPRSWSSSPRSWRCCRPTRPRWAAVFGIFCCYRGCALMRPPSCSPSTSSGRLPATDVCGGRLLHLAVRAPRVALGLPVDCPHPTCAAFCLYCSALRAQG